MSKIVDNINDIETIVDKQDTLVSGTNIKTVNGESVLGSGDLTLTIPETIKAGDVILTANGEYTVPQFADCNGAYIDIGVYPDLDTMLTNTKTYDGGAEKKSPDFNPTGITQGVAWSSDGTYMSVAHATSPFITIYKRSGDTFTKLANPATLPAGSAQGVAWSSDGTYMSVTHATSPFITIYKRSGDTFTKLANPATLPTGDGTGVSWSSDGTYMSVAHDNSPFITIYSPFNKLILPNLSNPSFPTSPNRLQYKIKTGVL